MPSALVATRPGAFALGPARLERAQRIHDFVYMSTGCSNSYLVVTQDGNVVINTGMGFEAPHHRRLFREVDDGPIRFVVLTQGHVDHVGGVDLFREDGTQVIAQRNNAACQRDDERIEKFRRSRSFVFFDHIIRAAIEAARTGEAQTRQAKPRPTLLFDDRYEFTLGGVRFELLSVPGGETIDSLCVWLPDQRIAFTGNQLGPLFPHFPNLYTIRGDKYRFADAYLDSLERVMALEPELLVTGHFEPIRGAGLIREELARLRDAVRHVHDATLQGMNDGKDVFTLMREIRLSPELAVGEGYGKVAWAVRAIWEGCGGWFQFRSTTELYEVPARDVYPEVAELAGGPGPLAARAARRVEAGEPLEALHLSEMALAAERQHRGALEARLAALELLLERSGGVNFWEVKWLRHRIAATQAALGLETTKEIR